jgi:hypothetical protein
MWRMVVTIALMFAALCFVLQLATPAHAQRPIITGWLAANTECKSGPGDDPKTIKACAKRDEIGARLKRRGCLYQDGDWWKCPHH